MAWTDRFRRRPPDPDPAPPVAASPSDPWHDEIRLLGLGGAGDWLTLGDCYTGIAALGGTGSGKTSSLAVLGLLLMKLGAGFVWMCAKADEELALVLKLARRAGVADDVYIIGEGENHEISPFCFNPLDYEVNAPGATTASVVQYLSLCQEVLTQGRRKSSGGGDNEKFWQTQFERLLGYCIDTGKHAGLTLTIELLRKIQLSAPLTAAQADDPAWQKESTCWQCLLAAADRNQQGEVGDYDVQRLVDFWTADYVTLDSKVRATVNVMFAALADTFTAGEPVRSILTTYTNITPDDVINKGAIVVLNLPTQKYQDAGRLAQFCFKYSFQRAMLRRPKDGPPLRPTVLWVDEAHNFCHAMDATYFAEVRSKRGINVWLEQGVNGYKIALGANSNGDVDHFLANLQTKFFFQNSSPESNKFAAEVLGKRRMIRETQNWNQSEDGTRAGGGESFAVEYQVEPGEFSEMRTGGPQNGLIVDAYIYKRGTRFLASGTNYLPCQLPQTELTR